MIFRVTSGLDEGTTAVSAKAGEPVMSEAAASEVLVVGAGPSGLFAAVELNRRGVPTRIVERDPVPHTQARATAVQPGTLEILADAGVVDRVLAESCHLTCARLFDAHLRQVGEIAFSSADCPWPFQCSLPQWRTERILAERLRELGARVDRGVTVTGMHQRKDGVIAELQRADGTSETVEAGWVIGAGGAHSVTRKSMAESLAGSTYPGSSLVAEGAMTCDLPRDGSALIASREGYVLLVPLPGERWLMVAGDLDEDEARKVARNGAAGLVSGLISRRVPHGLCVEEVGWASPFRMHRRMAPEFSDRREFLLGDAGHLSSPFGGEGLNSGIHDGYNLGWKLALEVQGHGRRRELLDTFATERRVADQHVLEVSDHLHQLVYGAVESARTGIPPAPPTSEQVAAMVRSRSMLDVSYPAGPLVGQYPAGARNPQTPAPGDRYPDRAALAGTEHQLLLFGRAEDPSVEDLRRRWLGLVNINHTTADPRRAGAPAHGAILVRPDGHIGFRAPADSAGLEALDAHLGCYLISN